MRNPYRFLARIVIETQTPLCIGSGNKGIKTDSLVLRDVNGLPFIPGTTIAGLLRHAVTAERNKNEEEKAYKKRLEAVRSPLMGSQDGGSPLIITDAKMLNQHGKVLDGIVGDNDLSDDFSALYMKQLPIRQHVRIGHRGVTEQGGKFDEEIVVKGTRFCFEMEMQSDSLAYSRCKPMAGLLATLSSETFRIGAGSRSGFGVVSIVSLKFKGINLADPQQRQWYLDKSSSLSGEEWDAVPEHAMSKDVDTNWTKYEIKGLQPVDFILFGSGFGSDKADMSFVRESYVSWTGNEATIVHGAEKDDDGNETAVNVILIPGSSVKGALSHRTAFHYNKLEGIVIQADGTLPHGKTEAEVTGKNNNAVKAIFGSEGERDVTTNQMKNKQRGRILISDIIKSKEPATQPKVLNHVSIDRFTGGAIDGALFNEETLYANSEHFDLEILVHGDAFKETHVQEAFESALKDLCAGMLPLGGGVNRGNGCFENGKLFRNGEQIYGNN